MTARDEVLARVRSAASRGAAPGPVPRDYRSAGGPAPGAPELVELFVGRLADHGAAVHRVAPGGSVAEAVAAAVRRPGQGRERPILVVPADLPADWLPAAAAAVPDDDLPIERVDDADGVVTAAALAIAETGTIVLDGSAGQGRRVLSLLPDLHVCVLRADQVVGTVPAAVARLDPTRPLTWISGPSATSDIELTRVEGVHGPRHLHVVLLC
jgi:L-lactate dehydrogenase complex protein LldG